MAYVKDSEADMTPATSEESVAVPEPSGRRKQCRIPRYPAMVKKAITSLKNKRGTSSKQITRYITAHYCVKKLSCQRAVARCLKRMMAGGLIYKTKPHMYKLTGKGRKFKVRGRKGRSRRLRKGGRRRRRRRRGRKAKKGRKGRRRRRRRGRKGRKGRKGRRRRTRRRRTSKRSRRAGRRRSRKGRRGGRRRRRR